MAQNVIIRLDSVHRRFRQGGGVVSALAGISLDVREGEFVVVVVVEPSGAGKSTFLHVVAGIDRPTEDEVLVNGSDLTTMRDIERTRFRRRHLGLVFQQFN